MSAWWRKCSSMCVAVLHYLRGVMSVCWRKYIQAKRRLLHLVIEAKELKEFGFRLIEIFVFDISIRIRQGEVERNSHK